MSPLDSFVVNPGIDHEYLSSYYDTPEMHDRHILLENDREKRCLGNALFVKWKSD